MKVAILIPRIHRNQTTRLLIKTINLIEAVIPVLLHLLHLCGTSQPFQLCIFVPLPGFEPLTHLLNIDFMGVLGLEPSATPLTKTLFVVGLVGLEPTRGHPQGGLST